MWPIQLAFLLFIVCRILQSPFNVCNTSFLTWSVQLIFSILLQHHVAELSRYCLFTLRCSRGLVYISLPNTCKSVGFWLQRLTVALLLYIVHIPVVSHKDTQVDVLDSTFQPFDTEWRFIVALIHEYVPSARHRATVNTLGKQKYFVVGGPEFGSWQVQEIHNFFQSPQTGSGFHALHLLSG